MRAASISRDVDAGELEDCRRATEPITPRRRRVPPALPIVVHRRGRRGADRRVHARRRRRRDRSPARGHRRPRARSSSGSRSASAELPRELDRVAPLRAMIEDLLKDLIRTERRSIDLEERLAHATGATETAVADDAGRRRSCSSSTTATSPTSSSTARGGRRGDLRLRDRRGGRCARPRRWPTRPGLDLALVAAQLPGIDGLETVRRLREQIPGLPAFLMTRSTTPSSATSAADLGVVGFVHKPIDDLDEVVDRLAQLAQRVAAAHPRARLPPADQGAPRARAARGTDALPREPRDRPMISRISHGRGCAQHQAALRVVAAARDDLQARPEPRRDVPEGDARRRRSARRSGSISTLPSASVIVLTGVDRSSTSPIRSAAPASSSSSRRSRRARCG